MGVCFALALVANAAEVSTGGGAPRGAAVEMAAPADVLAYPIGPGDVVRLEVIGEETMSGSFRVGGDGAIEVPYAGRIPISGLTVDDASRAITALLAQSVLARPQVVLDVETYASRRVDVDGIVEKPGTYALDKGRMTVGDLLVRAGGLKDASAPVALLFHPTAAGIESVKVDLERLYAGDASADVELRGGDRLYVPPVESVFVDGQAGKPGAIAYRDGMTVTQAIAQAGGALGTARKAGVYIVRGEQRIPVNLRKIQNGEAADIVLRPSDRIFIPESAF